APAARSLPIRAALRVSETLGLPIRLPCALARDNPALMRSDILSVSYLAMAAVKAMIASEKGPALEMYGSVNDTNFTPDFVSLSRIVSASNAPFLEILSNAKKVASSNLR